MSDDDERIAPRSPREEETPACSPDNAGETSETKDVANKATVQGGAAPHRFKTRNLVIGVAACAVAFCALITGIGYGLGWFSGDGSTDESPAAAFVSGSANQSNGDQTAESALDQDADTVEEADAANAGDNADTGIVAGEQRESGESEEANIYGGSNTSQGLENEAGNASADQNENAASGDPSGSSDNSGNAAASSLAGTTNSDTSENSEASSSPSNSSGDQDPSLSTQNNNRNSTSTDTSNNNTGNTNNTTDTISVSVYIDSSRAVPYGWDSCLGDTTVTVADGSSVYDALKATGLAIGGSSSYVASISGLAERACGSGSGWLYYVNGVSPGCACSQYTLSGGEDIKWIYTCDMGNDI